MRWPKRKSYPWKLPPPNWRAIAGDRDRTGQTIGMADPFIAAIALDHHLELVTGNSAHFQRIIRLAYPLTLVNWR